MSCQVFIKYNRTSPNRHLSMVTATYRLTQAGWPGVAVVEKAGLENYNLKTKTLQKEFMRLNNLLFIFNPEIVH